MVSSVSAEDDDLQGSLTDPVSLDVKADLYMPFPDNSKEGLVVTPSLNRQQGTPMIIEISGAETELMINIVQDEVSMLSGDSTKSFAISDYNILGNQAGDEVAVMPMSEGKNFLLYIGATIRENGEGYSGQGPFPVESNMLSLNFL